MACRTITRLTSPVAATKTSNSRQQNGVGKPNLGKDPCNPVSVQCSYSCKSFIYPSYCREATLTSILLKRSSHYFGSFRFQVPSLSRSFPFSPGASKKSRIEEKSMNVVENSMENPEEEKEARKSKDWVEKLLEIRNQWKHGQVKWKQDGHELCKDNKNENNFSDYDHDKNDGSDGSEVRYDCESFSKLLIRASLSDTKLFSQLAFLCNMAYVIQEDKAKDLRRFGLHYVTSSVGTKEEETNIEAKLKHSLQSVITLPIPGESSRKAMNSDKVHEESGSNDLLEIESRLEEDQGNLLQVYKNEVFPQVVVKVPAVKKENKELARELQPCHSSAFEWFICDEPCTYTRIVVIQGPSSLASWHSILFFEPTIFEAKEAVFVHKGIYDAAKNIHEQVIPEVMNHLQEHGDHAKLQFTGHSLGGSVSVLISLMLSTKNLIKPCAVKPVVTFGSPFVFCGGQKLFDELMLDETHICNVIMHQDIVPRCFSCNYPDYLVLILTCLNSSLHSHPCLIENKSLYSPLGKLFILQPNEKLSLSNLLIPPGC